MRTVKDMTIQRLKDLVGEVLENKLSGIFGDPDAGLSLRPEVEERLRTSLAVPSELRRAIPAADIARRLNTGVTFFC